jgi:hypothetical protein
MNLGKILGSISPAFGAISGNGLFGHIGPALAGGGLFGLGGILAKLLSHHGDDDPAMDAAPDPAMPQAPMPPRQFGMHDGQVFMGGRNPFGQNALGKFLGGIF